ncbi:MAG: hypothetical protein A3G77_07150 [Acidobacteria bacterium RIFCSPLOWO2_12_FULL_68_19]|nr:MAG: hypothetical protein A3G77_07150 [Acidobacteria bacterium RIFCSPLOWO2_12_FULL_68_19]
MVLMAAAAGAACDKAQLLAPTKATITVSAPTKVLAPGAATEITAYVIEEAGTPVQNGTTVRFTTTLGRVDPPEAQTRNGLAVTTFAAGNNSGVARIKGTSGGATGGSSNTDVVEITIGAAAVNTVTIRANPGSVGPSGGSVELTATVVGENGQALEGIGVTFTTDQGTLTASTVATNAGGEAKTTLTTTREAKVSATAGTKTSSTVTIAVITVNTITLRALPGSVGPTGGSVELIATVVADNGLPLEGVTVTFNADQGTLRSATVRTDANGEARTTLTTSQQTVVSATAGTKTSSNLTISVRAAPVVTVSCAPSSGSGNCSAVQASGSNNRASVLFTVTKASTSSVLRSATLDFGDGTSQSLGNLAGGSATIAHAYEGPSGSTARSYTATVQATDINSETASVSTTVTITPRQPLAVTLAATAGTAVSTVGQPVKLTATVTPTGDAGANLVQKYEWDFGDDSTAETTGNETTHVYTSEGRKTATVKVTTTDGRTASARTEFIVDF